MRWNSIRAPDGDSNNRGLKVLLEKIFNESSELFADRRSGFGNRVFRARHIVFAGAVNEMSEPVDAGADHQSRGHFPKERKLIINAAMAIARNFISGRQKSTPNLLPRARLGA